MNDAQEQKKLKEKYTKLLKDPYEQENNETSL